MFKFCLVRRLRTPGLLTFFMLLTIGHVFAQGAWNPPGADLSRPRTLVRASELPDLRNHLQTPVAHALLSQLWSNLNSYNPGNFQTDGQRRQAAHAAKNAAFFLLLNRKPVANGLDTLTTAEADDLRDLSIWLIENMNIAVAGYPTIEGYLWRSNEIIDNAIAYDLLLGAGVPDTALTAAGGRLQEYCGNLYTEVEFDFLNLGFFSLHVDNHALRTCGALGMAAIVLNDFQSGQASEQPSRWIQCALYNIDNVLWRDGNRQSTPGLIGGYSEGPHYLRFGFKHVLPFMHAMGNFLPDTNLSVSWDGNNRSVRNPWFDPNFDFLFEWYMRIRMPDGRPPALEDCFFVTAWEELAIREDARFTPVVDYSRFHQVQVDNLWEMLHHSSDDVVADYLSAMTPDQSDSLAPFQILPESGNLVFRSGWGHQDLYLHFSAKNGPARNGSKGHNQADASSFILGAYGEVMALDAGYLKWSRRGEVGEATNHNMVLVDGLGPLIGAVGSANDADAFIEDTYDLGQFDLGEVTTGYRGANIRRRNLMVRNKYFLMHDAVSHGQMRDFTWQLHGYGLEGGDTLHGTFEDGLAQGRGVWRRNAASLLAQVTAEGGVDQYRKGTNVHEWRYDSIQQHTTFYADVLGESEANFLAALCPYATDTPVVTELCAPGCGSVLVEVDGYREVATVSGVVDAQASGLTGDLVANGTFAFFSESPNGSMNGWVMEEGSSLELGSLALCSLSVAGDVALEVVDTATYACHSKNGGVLWLQGLAFEPLSVNGLPVQSWQYDIPSQTLEIVLGGGGYFTIHEGVVVNRAEPVLSDWQVYPNPSTGAVRIALAGEVPQGSRVEVRDMWGRLLLARPAEALNEFSGLAPGMYLVSLEAGGQRSSKKLLVRE